MIKPVVSNIVKPIFADGTVWLDRFDAPLTPITWQKDATVEVTPTTIKKVSGVNAWDAQAYSDQFLTGGCYLEFKIAGQADVMLGINTDPATNSGYASLDFTFWSQGNAIKMSESGVLSTSYGTRTNSTVFSIHYNNADVIYLIDGVEIRRIVGVGAGLSFAVDSSLNRVGSEINSIKFSKPQAITAHKPEIGTAYTGTATIVGSALVNQSGGDETANFIILYQNKELSFTSLTLNIRYTHFFRRGAGANFWYVVRVFSTNNFILYEVNSGVFINRGAVTVAYAQGERYRMTDIDNVITVFVDDVEIITYTSSFLAGEPLNIIQINAQGDTLDNLEVRAL